MKAKKLKWQGVQGATEVPRPQDSPSGESVQLCPQDIRVFKASFNLPSQAFLKA